MCDCRCVCVCVSKSVSKIHDQQIMHVPLFVMILLSTWNVFDELAIDVFIYEFTRKGMTV